MNRRKFLVAFGFVTAGFKAISQWFLPTKKPPIAPVADAPQSLDAWKAYLIIEQEIRNWNGYPWSADFVGQLRGFGFVAEWLKENRFESEPRDLLTRIGTRISHLKSSQEQCESYHGKPNLFEDAVLRHTELHRDYHDRDAELYALECCQDFLAGKRGLPTQPCSYLHCELEET